MLYTNQEFLRVQTPSDTAKTAAFLKKVGIKLGKKTCDESMNIKVWNDVRRAALVTVRVAFPPDMLTM